MKTEEQASGDVELRCRGDSKVVRSKQVSRIIHINP